MYIMGFYQLIAVFCLSLIFFETVSATDELHKKLTERELSYLFDGIENANHVPEYEVTYPIEVNARSKHSTGGADTDTLSEDGYNGTRTYHLPLGGRTIKLSLTLTFGIVSPHFQVVRRNGDEGAKIDSDLIKHAHQLKRCLHHGSHDNGHAAISTCNGGLDGVIVDGRNLYIIKPVPDRLAKRSADQTKAHIVYKRSTGTNAISLKNDVLYSDEVELLEELLQEDDDTKPIVAGKFTIELAFFVNDYQRLRHYRDPGTDHSIVHYFLLLMNVLQRTYYDRRLPKTFDLALVRLELFQEIPSALGNKRISFGKKLNLFSHWQRQMNPGDDSNPHHWDHAQWLTNGGGGLAWGCNMCSKTLSAAISGIGSGYGTAFTIAHEMGHNLCIGHDVNGIMYPTLTSKSYFSEPWHAKSIQEFDEAIRKPSRMGCLLDQAVVPKELQPNIGILPGLMISGDEQCRTTSNNVKILQCKSLGGYGCKALWCGSGGSCGSSTIPALEGTRCGTKKWCRNETCVSITNGAPGIVNGGWGDLKLVTDCDPLVFCYSKARAFKVWKRECDNPKPQFDGTFCSGNSHKQQLCPIQQCPTDKTQHKDYNSFMNAHCQKSLGFQRFWSLNGCRFNCAKYNWGGSLVNPKNNFLPDGAYCGNVDKTRPDRHMYCDRGACQEFGCDDKSPGLRRDLCNVCGGNNSTCQGNFQLDGGWRETSSSCGQLSPCVIRHGKVGLSMKKVTKVCDNPKPLYHFGGTPCEGKSEQLSICKDVKCSAGIKTIGTYIKEVCRKEFGSKAGSRDIGSPWDCQIWCFAPGAKRSKTNKPDGVYCKGGNGICISGKCQGYNTLVNCDGRFPTNNKLDACGICGGDGSICDSTTKFDWKVTWLTCSKSCAHGKTRTRIDCVNSKTGRVTSSGKCNAQTRPQYEEKACNTQPCPAIWRPKAWGQCSRPCDGGLKTRLITCERIIQNDVYELVSENQCKNIAKPHNTVAGCNSKHCDVLQWNAWGPWGQCSKECGGGSRIRSRSCPQSNSIHGNINFGCSGSKTASESCNSQPCGSSVDGGWSNWLQWSVCSKSCGSGSQKRSRKCDNPLQSGDGAPCLGNSEESRQCAMTNCPEIPTTSMSTSTILSTMLAAISSSTTSTLSTTTTSAPSTTTLSNNKGYIEIGCFNGRMADGKRVLPEKLVNFRTKINWQKHWYDWTEVVEMCQKASEEEDFEYFGVEYYGECWMAKSFDKTKATSESTCIHGDNGGPSVGIDNSIFVYQHDYNYEDVFD